MKTSPLPSIPRIESLHHRLKTAKGPDGEPLALLDELMVFLEDPPPDTGDRWQAGADFCATHGIETSRMSVWRLYRVHVLEWRSGQGPELGEVSEQATARLLERARHLVALRAVESLHHPHLPPRVLVGLVQNEYRRQELQLARDKFTDQLEIRRGLEHQRRVKAIDAAHHARAVNSIPPGPERRLIESLMKSYAAEEAPPLYPTTPRDNTP